MAIAPKSYLSEDKRVSSPVMDLIGATVIPLSSALPLNSAASRQSSMVRAIVQTGDGGSDFESLSSALRQRPHSILLYAFDLLHLDYNDLRQQTLLERRSILKALLGSDDQSRIQFSDEFNVIVMHYSKHALSGDLKALSLNMYWHPIDLVAAKLGSRPSASPNLPLS